MGQSLLRSVFFFFFFGGGGGGRHFLSTAGPQRVPKRRPNKLKRDAAPDLHCGEDLTLPHDCDSPSASKAELFALPCLPGAYVKCTHTAASTAHLPVPDCHSFVRSRTVMAELRKHTAHSTNRFLMIRPSGNDTQFSCHGCALASWYAVSEASGYRITLVAWCSVWSRAKTGWRAGDVCEGAELPSVCFPWHSQPSSVMRNEGCQGESCLRSNGSNARRARGIRRQSWV